MRLLVAERGWEACWGAGRWLVEGEGGRGKGEGGRGKGEGGRGECGIKDTSRCNHWGWVVVCREWRIWGGMLVWVLMLVIFFEGMAGRLDDSESNVVVIYSCLPDPEYNFRGRNTSCHVMVSGCTIH